MLIDILTLPVRLAYFALWFAKEIVVSSASVTRDELTFGLGSTPRVVRMDLGEVGDAHEVAISTLITLTPGTLTLGVPDTSTDSGRAIMVHSLYHRSAAEALVDLEDMDRRLTRAVRIGDRG